MDASPASGTKGNIFKLCLLVLFIVQTLILLHYKTEYAKLTNVVGTSSSAPEIFVGVITSPAKTEYLERYMINADPSFGWHRQFYPNLRAYTFDEIPKNIPKFQYDRFDRILPLEGEKKNYHVNTQLWSWKLMHDASPDASWYLQVDDDTVIAKHNLDAFVRELDQDKPEVHGYCGILDGHLTQGKGDIVFVIGGGGTLMSKAAMKLLLPHLETCRMKYNYLRFGDSRVFACLKFEAGISAHRCASSKSDNGFSSYPLNQTLQTRNPKGRVISVHEKDGERATLLNKLFTRKGWSSSPNDKEYVSWGLLKTEFFP